MQRNYYIIYFLICLYVLWQGKKGRSAARVQRVQKVQKERFLRWTGPMGRRVLKFDGPLARGLWYRPQGDEFYNAACGGHVHIEYHNQDYHRPPPRHFVALFP